MRIHLSFVFSFERLVLFCLLVCLAYAGTECSLASCGFSAQGFSEAGLKDEVDHRIVEGR